MGDSSVLEIQMKQGQGLPVTVLQQKCIVLTKCQILLQNLLMLTYSEVSTQQTVKCKGSKPGRHLNIRWKDVS